MKLFVLIIGILFVFAGCATVQQAPSVCDTLGPGQSVICDMAQEVGQSPETVAGILKLANVGALSADLYTAQEANQFIEDTIDILEVNAGGVTYTGAVLYVVHALAQLSPETQALFIVLSDFIAIETDDVLTAIDMQMLIKHLREQQAIVAPFLMVS